MCPLDPVGALAQFRRLFKWKGLQHSSASVRQSSPSNRRAQRSLNPNLLQKNPNLLLLRTLVRRLMLLYLTLPLLSLPLLLTATVLLKLAPLRRLLFLCNPPRRSMSPRNSCVKPRRASSLRSRNRRPRRLRLRHHPNSLSRQSHLWPQSHRSRCASQCAHIQLRWFLTP